MPQYLRKYGVASKVRVAVYKAGTTDFAVSADWTPATGDVKISKDGGAAANLTSLPTAITMGNGAVWEFSLTATEMLASEITITVVDSATKAVNDLYISIQTDVNKISVGTAVSSTTSTIELASTWTGDPTGMSVVITSSAGIENRVIDSYAPLTKVATVVPAFALTPTGTVTYSLYAFGARVIDDYADDGEVATIEGMLTTITNLINSVLDRALLLATPSDVNDQVVDALTVDTYNEPGQVTPPVITTLANKLNHIYKVLFNPSEQTATLWTGFNRAGSRVDQKATVIDDGTKVTRGPTLGGP
jgi:hypothetical protein